MPDAKQRNGDDHAKAVVVEAFARHRIQIHDNDPMIAIGTVVELAIERGAEVLEQKTENAVARIEWAASQWVEAAKFKLISGAKDAVLMALSANTGAMKFKWIATGCALCLGSMALGMILMLLFMRYMHS